MNSTCAMIYIVGNDTLHFDNENYYQIVLADTFYIDSTRVFVKYYNQASSYDKVSIEIKYNLSKEKEYNSIGWICYSLSQSNRSFIGILSDLNNESIIDQVDLNTSVYYACDALEPSDDDFNDQWYLERIQAPSAWALTTGDPNIIVAIIDDGFDWTHADLGPGNDNYDNIYLNQDLNPIPTHGEDPWDDWDDPTTGDKDDNEGNDCEDDWKGWGEMYLEQGGYTDGNDVRNYSYQFLKDELGDDDDADALWKHGTFIAGIIGAKTNNEEGISGIAGGWGNKGISLVLFKKGICCDGQPMSQNVVQGILYAVDDLPYSQKAQIIEMPFMVNDWNNIIHEAIDHAIEKGAFLVAAAGNHASGGQWYVTYPASDPDVFAVGATDHYDIRKINSNYGPDHQLDLCAPGDDILSLVPQDGHDDDGYQTIEGKTSAASAMVAGTAALMLSVNPELTNLQIAQILRDSADKGEYYIYDEGYNPEIGYGRLNAYRSVCGAMALAEDWEISNGTIILDSDRSFMNSIYIKDGATLTITAKIEFGPEAKLVVEQGGTLIIDGGTLTNMKCCGYEFTNWPGIQVWGDRFASQYAPGAQGKLIVNSGTIENALLAVDLWKPGTTDMTGGIIEAHDALFLNNAKSVRAIYYRNFNPDYPNLEMDYYSNFDDCSFILDDQYFGTALFEKHVDLAQVRGLKFYGCTFSLDHTAEFVSYHSIGIAAYNAGFYILPTCTTQVIPCPVIDSCWFNGFNFAIGVWTPAQLTDHPILITNAHFDNNSTGVYINDHDYTVILENFFEAGYDDPYHGNCDFADGVGVDIHQSNGFIVENNKLRKNSLATSGNYAGIRVKDCPSEHDIIYKNEFDGLSYGNYAEGTNRLSPRDDETGIEYQCNCNSHNAVDFMVQFIGTDTAGAMIRGWHGDQNNASGNVFSRYTPSVMHFSNRGKSTINYYFCDPCTDEEPINIFTWKPEYFEKEISNGNTCPDHYGGGGHIKLTFEERLDKEESFAQNLSDYNSVIYLYESLEDGGNSETELSDIESAEPDDMWELRSQLLGHSPHLSQEVLRAMANRTDVFPDDVLLEILSANPDELNRDTLISYLEQKEDPLPEYMIDILRQAVSGITYKTILENEIAQYHAAKTQAAQDIIRSILFDTVFNVTDYRNWLDNLDNIVADRQIISTYLSENDTSSAIALLNLLPSLYELEGDELEDYNEYKYLVEMQMAYKTEGRLMNELDSSDILGLDAIASDESFSAGNIARNILSYAGIHQYCNCLPFIDSSYMKNTFVSGTNTMIGNDILKISAKPNPARTYVAFDYELMTGHAAGLINISDIHGKVIWQIQVSGKKGQKVWNTTRVQAGVYYFNLLSDGLNKTGKIVIF